ncbi:MAG: hypothetical protein GY920_21825 [Aliivibrio sp.]|nr:hypothetical protein [Aliivibrio sp.]
MHSVVDEIIQSNNWRNGEFAKYKSNSLNVDEQLWCRMCIPMIYAHWEGFIVSSLKIMLNHLNRLKIETKNLPSNLVVVGLGDAYRKLSGKQSFQQKIEFTEKFDEILAAPVKFNTKVDTKSNLRADIFYGLCDSFNFNTALFRDEDELRDIDRLVQIRNSIAHGENSFVLNMEKINNYIDAVNKITDIFLDEIDEYLSNKRYLK